MSKKAITTTLALLIAAPVLSGCVAVAATGLVAGVSAVRQERTVGAAFDDVRIKSAITGELANVSASNFLNVSTTVIEGRVLLTGRVSNPEMRLSATRAAWSIDGVRKVDNEIEVTDSVGWLDRRVEVIHAAPDGRVECP